MGCVGSKEELQAKASSLALSAQSIGSKYFAEASELAAIYNPLQAKGDPNSSIKKATELTVKVKTTEKEWKEFTNEAKGALDSSRVALESPMPTLYTTNLPTGATATPNSQLLGGPGFDGAAFESAKVKLEETLNEGSYTKMDAWVTTLKGLGAQQRTLNSLWADVDKKTKEVAAKQQALADLRAKAAAGDNGAAGKVPTVERELSEKESALKAAQAAHDGEESQQYERLKAALAQAPTLSTNIANALEAVAAAMTSARQSITASPAGAVGYTAPASVPQAVAEAVRQVPVSVPAGVTNGM